MILPTDDKNEIANLKKIGHDLLDRYIELDPYGGGRARTRAYNKLTEKLGASYQVHFASMNTTEELTMACQKLRKMIRKLEKRILTKSKEEYADARLVKIELDRLKRLRKGEDVI